MVKAVYYLDRFLGMIRYTDTCWIWEGQKDKFGYGNFSILGKKVRAHRFAYEEFVGDIPEGLVIDHLCRNHSCVNPNHLEPVTTLENLMRGETMNVLNKLKPTCPQGHQYSGENLYVDPRGNRQCRLCRRLSNRKSHHKRVGIIE